MPGQMKREHRRKSASPSDSRPSAREELMAAGVRLIAERGVEAVNSNVIARAAGVGVGTFYAHFDDKHDLHHAAVEYALDLLRGELSLANATTRESAVEEQVRALVTAVFDFAAARPELFRLAFGPGPRPAGRGRPALGLSIRAVESRLRELQREGRVDPALDPAVAATGYAGMQSAVLLWWLAEPAAPARARVIETLVRLHPALSGGRIG